MTAPAASELYPQAESRPKSPFHKLNELCRNVAMLNDQWRGFAEFQTHEREDLSDQNTKEWIELHEERPVMTERLPSLNPLKW